MPSKVFKYFIGMGASQSGLRPMESKQSSRVGLPNGDDLPCHMEDAPIDRVSEDEGNGTSPAEPTRSRSETDRESLRGSSTSVLPIREDSSRRITRLTTQGTNQRGWKRRPTNYPRSGSDKISNETEVGSGIPGDGPTSRASEERPAEAYGPAVSSNNSEKTPKNCFLDKTRPCGPDCMAFDAHWKVQPCSLLRALKVTIVPVMPPPPKVKL